MQRVDSTLISSKEVMQAINNDFSDEEVVEVAGRDGSMVSLYNRREDYSILVKGSKLVSVMEGRYEDVVDSRSS